MKKTIKMLGLLLVAACLFASCANSSSSSDDKKSSSADINKPLVDVSELTEDATAITMDDGTWTYRTIHESQKKGSTTTNQLQFPVKNGQFYAEEDGDYVFTTSTVGTIPPQASEEMIEEAKKMGWKVDGDKYSYSKKYKTADLKKLKEAAEPKIAADPTIMKGTNDPEVMDYLNFQQIFMDAMSLSSQSGISGLKTNSGHTAYAWSDKEEEYFLAKN